MGRLASDPAQFFVGEIFYLGCHGRDFLHMSRFAAFAPIGHRCQIGAIRFQHEPICRRRTQSVPNTLCVLESQDAGEADKRAEINNLLHLGGRANKAVKNPPYFARERRQLSQRGFETISLVDNTIQPQFRSGFELLLKELSLPVFVALVVRGRALSAFAGQVMIVQARLAHRDHFRVPGHFTQS